MVTRTKMSEAEQAEFNKMVEATYDALNEEALEDAETERQEQINIAVLAEEYTSALEAGLPEEADKIAKELAELGVIIQVKNDVVSWKYAGPASEGGGTEPEGETDA